MDKLITFLVVIVGWIFSLCLHEFSHALVAYYGGDTSVKDKGYLTFNPLKYTHPVYSILMPVIFLMLGGIGLPGGAVYIETWRLRSRKWESAVALAGPLANLLVALLLAVVIKILPSAAIRFIPGLAFLALMQISALVLNLLPVPPMDGYRVVAPYLNPQLRQNVDRYSVIIMLVVFMLLWYVPFVNSFFWNIIFSISDLLTISHGQVALGYMLFRLW